MKYGNGEGTMRDDQRNSTTSDELERQLREAEQAQADADVSKTYAASFGKDPQFYDFYRAMQSYRTTFVGEAGSKAPAPTTVILSPNDDYLKEFSGHSR